MNNSTPVFIIDNKKIYQHEVNQDIQKIQIYLNTLLNIEYCVIALDNSYYFAIILLAVLSAGKIPVLLPNNQPGTIKQYRDEHQHLSHILLNNEQLVKTILDNKDATSDNNIISSDAKIILYTSGSTGRPKKISRYYKNIMAEINCLENAFGKYFKQDSLVYTTVSQQHLYGLLFSLLWPYHKNRTIVIPRLEFPEQIEKIAKENRQAIIVSCPSIISRLSADNIDYTNHCIFSSGAKLENFDNNISPIEVLGSTETGGVAFREQLKDPVWQAFADCHVYQDNHSKALVVESPFFNSTSAIIMSDKVKMISNNRFELLERLDRIVKIEGKRVSLIEIEERLKDLDIIDDAYSLMIKTYRQCIAGLIVLSDKGNQLLRSKGKLEVRQIITQKLKNYFETSLCPKKLIYTDKIPRNTQGKILATEIKSLFTGGDDA